MPVPTLRALEPVAHLGTTVQAFADRPRSLSAALRRSAATWPDRPALVTPTGERTHAELDGLVDAVAGRLAAALAGTPVAGEAATSRTIGVALGHEAAMVAIPFACSRIGARALLLNPGLADERWAAQLARLPVDLLVGDATHADRLARLGHPAPVLRLDEVGGVDGTEPGWTAADDVADDELAPVALLATSGTTGVPKITAVTNRGLLHAALAYAELLDLDQTDRSLVVLPLHYIGPLSAQTTAMVCVGGCTVLPARTGAVGAIAAMADHAITHLDAVPAWLGQLLRDPEPQGLPRWRTLIYGGAPMPPATVDGLAVRFPDVALHDIWGLSETHGPATARRHDGISRAPGDVGTPIAGVEVRAVDGDGVAVPPGTPGELLVRGANVTPGYVDDPTTTAAVLRDGWLATGDVGAIDDDGSVRILDRRKDVILRGGANVFSVEVEAVLRTFDGILDAAVFGVPDALGGEAVAAAVVLAPGVALDVRALRTHVSERIGLHAAPRHVRQMDSLPRNATGKIDKHALRAAGSAERRTSRARGRR